MPATPTTKYALVPRASSDAINTLAAGEQAFLGLIDGLLAPWSSGVLTSRPAPGKSGRRYLATDVGSFGCEYVDTGSVWVIPSGSVKLAEVILGGTGPINFSSIPQGFRHLRLEGYVRSSRAGFSDTGTHLTLNSNTSALYQHTSLAMQGTSLVSAGASGETFAFVGAVAAAAATAGAWSGIVIDIPLYSGSAFKTLQARTNGQMAGGYKECVGGAEWQSTNPVGAVTLDDDVSGGFVAGSCVTLHGIT